MKWPTSHDEVWKQVQEILGDISEFVIVGEDVTRINCANVGNGLTFDMLQKLSRYFGTKLIDIESSVGTDDYSEYTPGDPPVFCIVIYKDE